MDEKVFHIFGAALTAIGFVWIFDAPLPRIIGSALFIGVGLYWLCSKDGE